MSSKEHTLKSSADVKRESMLVSIKELLAECTEDQACFFNRIHNRAPWKGIDNCPENRLAESYQLIRRTVIENRAKERITIASAEGRR